MIIIQFVVITNGAGRVAEAQQSFTLDAMPGKQMSVDADLSSGLINQEEARRRRADVANEADFYGAMDGASKFVRGDAIAAIVIVAINLIGGLAIGILQRHIPISEAGNTYSLLSVGDGLVSQIPALLLSLSTGIVVTRAAGEGDFADRTSSASSRVIGGVTSDGIRHHGACADTRTAEGPVLHRRDRALFHSPLAYPDEEVEDGPELEAQPGLAPVPDTPAQLARETAIPELELELGG